MNGLQTIPISWTELARRTWREMIDDDVAGLAAQLSYYSSSPYSRRSCSCSPSPASSRSRAFAFDPGLLTFGVAGALWSSSAALVSIVGALNRAYDINEARPRWQVRLVAIGLTFGVATIILLALSLPAFRHL